MEQRGKYAQMWERQQSGMSDDADDAKDEDKLQQTVAGGQQNMAAGV
jgi:hypothetical protein